MGTGNAPGKRRPAKSPLTAQQRRLVDENLGLVMVHLTRHLGPLDGRRRHREWEDLFQEGCLGLIKAAVAYRPDSGMSFATFALPRIHRAVSRALTSARTIRPLPQPEKGVPAEPASNRPDSATVMVRAARANRMAPSTRRSRAAERKRCLIDKRRHDPRVPPAETIGERLRGKYERAVRAAGAAMTAHASPRGDRAALIRTLVEERLLVPSEEARRGLRQIARDTGSSYGRVAQCERGLRAAARRRLDADPEVRRLRAAARTDPRGTDTPIDAALERELAEACAEAFIKRFRATPAPKRARLLNGLLNVWGDQGADWLRLNVVLLSTGGRERLLLQEPSADRRAGGSNRR